MYMRLISNLLRLSLFFHNKSINNILSLYFTSLYVYIHLYTVYVFKCRYVYDPSLLEECHEKNKVKGQSHDVLSCSCTVIILYMYIHIHCMSLK